MNMMEALATAYDNIGATDAAERVRNNPPRRPAWAPEDEIDWETVNENRFLSRYGHMPVR